MVDKSTYQRAYKLEKEARKEAERILEEKTLELYALNSELEHANKALKKQQSTLIRTEKFAALGQLSAGIAHEINNPLAFVISNMSTLEKYWRALTEKIDGQSLDDKTRFMLEDAMQMFPEMNEGLIRVKDIVVNLKSLARTQPGEMSAVNVNECVESALTILKNETKFHCQIEFKKGDIPLLKGSESELTQVFINLILNAAHAIREAGHDLGKIEISTSCDEPFISISIGDNGIGIPSENIDKIFNPFFTSKPVGEGTGLGLSVSFGIVENLGGTISVESEKGVGATFTVLLPIDTNT